MLKKIFGVCTLVLFLGGCGAAMQESEFGKHKSMYKNWDHMKYSLWGYQNPSDEVKKKSREQGWWGIEIK